MRVAGIEHFRNQQRAPLQGSTDSDPHMNGSAEKEPQERDHTGPGRAPPPTAKAEKPHNLGILARVLKMSLGHHCWENISLSSHPI